MKSFHLTVSSPEGNLFSGECTKLDVRGTEGELAVMAGHAPFVTCLAPGDCTLHLPDGTQIHAYADGGFLTVGTDKVTLLSGSFSRLEP